MTSDHYCVGMDKQVQGRHSQWKEREVCMVPYHGKRYTDTVDLMYCVYIRIIHVYIHYQDPLAGVIPRSLHELFEKIEAQVRPCHLSNQ